MKKLIGGILMRNVNDQDNRPSGGGNGFNTGPVNQNPPNYHGGQEGLAAMPILVEAFRERETEGIHLRISLTDTINMGDIITMDTAVLRRKAIRVLLWQFLFYQV